jgi:uncharacterized protein
MKKSLCALMCGLCITTIFSVGSAAAGSAPKKVFFATKPIGGAVYYLAAGMAVVWKKYAGVDVVVQPMPGIKQWGPLMKAGEMDLAMDNTLTAGATFRGMEYFEVEGGKLTCYRMVAAGHETFMTFWTRPDSGIKSFKDFEGKRIVVSTPPALPDSVVLAKVLLDDYYKLAGKYKRLEIGSPAECTNALIEGRIDAYQYVSGPHIEELKRSVGVVGIPVPKEAAEYCGQKIPGMYPGAIPKGMYGLEADVPCAAWRSGFYASERLDDNLVYSLLTALYSHLDEFHPVHPMAAYYVLDNATKGFTVPFHSGAVKFYKEKGLWTPELEKIQEKFLSEVK